MDNPVPQEVPETPELKVMPTPWTSAVLRPESVKLKCPRQMSTKIKGGWPRPPLNYSIFITLALCNSASGSLTVQQIYQFTRYLLSSQLLVQNEGKRDNEEYRNL